MRILFDQGTPVPISGYLTGHVVGISADLGWDQLGNGELLVFEEITSTLRGASQPWLGCNY